MQLAEGEIGSKAQRAELAAAGERPAAKFSDRDDHIYFWFPLLAGLSEMTFDPRQEIRCVTRVTSQSCCAASNSQGHVGALKRLNRF